MYKKFEILKTIYEDCEINFKYDLTYWLEHQKRKYQTIKKYENIVNLSFYKLIRHRR